MLFVLLIAFQTADLWALPDIQFHICSLNIFWVSIYTCDIGLLVFPLTCQATMAQICLRTLPHSSLCMEHSSPSIYMAHSLTASDLYSEVIFYQ